jgi:uracil-DNA glycosylase family 4
MGIAADDILADWHASVAALAWQLDMGLTDVIGENPVSAYDLPDTSAQRPAPQPAPPPVPSATAVQGDPVKAASDAADGAGSLAALHQALKDFDGCELKRGARNTVFADGNPRARVLVLGEAPGREEDLEGRPFVGPAGQLLDRMFAAIGLSRAAQARETAIYITNVLPWRPPGNRDPSPEEVALLMPFVRRHIELAAPDVIVTLGNTPFFALTGNRGIVRARGIWGQALGRPNLPMLHPAYLLRNPAAKREAWADLLSLQDWLRRNPG